MSTRRLFLVAPVSLALLLAACGSSGTSSSSPSKSSATTSASASMSKDTVQLHKTSLGNVLANADGRTLYAFMQDVGGKSACAGSCAQVWPPLTSSAAPTAGAGLDATKLALIARDGGMQQVTYGGIPLYVYSKDTSADDSYGQGIGGVWFVVGADGKPITAPAAATTTTAQRTSSY